MARTCSQCRCATCHERPLRLEMAEIGLVRSGGTGGLRRMPQAQRSERGFRLEVGRFALAPGEMVAIVGPSGSGKSAFLELAGLAAAPLAQGTPRMALDGADVWALWQRPARRALARLRARAYGFVLQQGGLHPFLTVRGNLALAQSLAGEAAPARAAALLERLGLGSVAAAFPAALSVGQRQRAAVARALAHRPALVVADEPTSALDPENAATVMALLADLAAEEGAAVVLATHDRAAVAALGIAAVEVAGRTEGDCYVARVERC